MGRQQKKIIAEEIPWTKTPGRVNHKEWFLLLLYPYWEQHISLLLKLLVINYIGYSPDYPYNGPGEWEENNHGAGGKLEAGSGLPCHLTTGAEYPPHELNLKSKYEAKLKQMMLKIDRNHIQIIYWCKNTIQWFTINECFSGNNIKADYEKSNTRYWQRMSYNEFSKNFWVPTF